MAVDSIKTGQQVLSGQAKRSPEEEKILQACRDFETIFIHQMLRKMRDTVPKAGLFGEESMASQIYQDMQDEETAKRMAAAGGIGLAEMMYRQLTLKE